MQTEFRRADPERELRSLLKFDRAVFRVSDRFPADYWRELESYWMLVGGFKVGCCGFELWRDALYIATTGIHPRFQRQGFGRLMKSWEICFARRNGFKRIVTNVRARNAAMIALNVEFGFKRLRRIERYYSGPADATLVMELRL